MSLARPSSLARVAAAVGALVLLALFVRIAPAQADAFGPQFPISAPGHESEDLEAGFPDVAYNTVTDQSLVVYIASTTNDTEDIYGQRLDGAGNRVGPEFRISQVSRSEEYEPPAVGYDAESGRYLVSWDDDETVYVRLVSPDGVPLGNEAPISAAQNDIETTAIAYSPVAHEYMVVWKAFGDGRVFSQRLNQDGVQIGADDAIVAGNEALTVDDAVDLAYNATSLEYMVVFLASSDVTLDGEEVYGQRLSLNGAEVGANDFQISQMGGPGEGEYEAAPPSVAWNSVLNQYLVAWHGEDGPPLVQDEREVYGQLLAADGSPVGADDFRISDLGPDGDDEFDAYRPRIAFDQFSDQYLVVWHGGEIGLAPEEFEVWGQYLAGDGSQIGNNDFRVSEVLPDGEDMDFSASRPAVAFDSRACDYIVTYSSGNPKNSEATVDAVLGRRVSAPPACSPPASLARDTTAPVLSGLRVAPKTISSGIKAKKKGTAKSSKKKVAKRAKARYTLSEPATVVLTVERKQAGIKIKGKCRKAKPGSKRSGKRCSLWTKTGRKLTQEAAAGANAKTFTAKSFRKKGLKPGAYRIVVVATDAAGNGSAPARAGFKVAGPR